MMEDKWQKEQEENLCTLLFYHKLVQYIQAKTEVVIGQVCFVGLHSQSNVRLICVHHASVWILWESITAACRGCEVKWCRRTQRGEGGMPTRWQLVQVIRPSSDARKASKLFRKNPQQGGGKDTHPHTHTPSDYGMVTQKNDQIGCGV